jgi:alkane 1-monooxygenase
MQTLIASRFALAWLLPLAVATGAWFSPWSAWAAMTGVQLLLAAAERLPALQHSPAPREHSNAWFRFAVRVHVPLQLALLVMGLWMCQRGEFGVLAAAALGVAIGGVTGGQGITFAHELGHSKSRVDRALAWLLMGSVNYSHFMVEHYRGHHPRAATFDDPASARRGETLWRFLPRTLVGSFSSGWRLEWQRLRQLKRSAWHSPLVWASALQLAVLVLIGLALGPLALVFWLVQSAYAVLQLEAINYIEHYGLQREVVDGKREPFAMHHAWNADSWLTNCFIANLQRHSDHHMHAWKPYPTLEALPGPQLPTGYTGCLLLVMWPKRWFAVMHPRLDAVMAQRPVAA